MHDDGLTGNRLKLWGSVTLGDRIVHCAPRLRDKSSTYRNISCFVVITAGAGRAMPPRIGRGPLSNQSTISRTTLPTIKDGESSSGNTWPTTTSAWPYLISAAVPVHF